MKKILIFDAYPSIRQLLAEELTAEGYVTMSAGKAEFLSEAVESFGPDLIVLDLFVRGGILWSLLEDLKERYPAIPILLFTAFHPNEFPRFKQADGWAQKSFLFEDLKQKIRTLLEKKGGPSALREPIPAEDSNRFGRQGPSEPATLPWAH
jgi:DNA-binding response OmpR family regulator